MKALGTLIKQHVPTLQNHLVCVSLKVLNKDWPRLAVLRAINVKDARNDMRVGLVNMHEQCGRVAIEAKAIRVVAHKFLAGPLLVHRFQFLEHPLSQVRPVDEPCLRPLDHIYGSLQPRTFLHALPNSLPQSPHQVLRRPRQSPSRLRKIGRRDGRACRFDVRVVTLPSIGDASDLLVPPFHDGSPSGQRGIVRRRPRMVPSIILGESVLLGKASANDYGGGGE
mmetsp:Transcript_6506/g.11340  ORF Transcript_6506/g.11340 Transcript_6506/m.11340 type:complete len:224 (-) Transcript_6506:133-804(-)